MGFENLGPNVSQNPQKVQEPANGSGAYTSQDHSWEQLVIQQNKPSADWEINLLQSILGAAGIRLLSQQFLPSGWLNADFLERSNVTGDYTFLAPDTTSSTTANTFALSASTVNVNGWLVNFNLTAIEANTTLPNYGVQGTNYVVLPAPPLGGERTDLVILEVWRALVSPAPDSTNKSQAGQILRYGNVKSPDVSPNQNLSDDLVDPTFAEETARRVQIQYRYRVISNLPDKWLQAFPDGLDCPVAVANTIPAYPSPGPDGSPTGFQYMPSPGDAGLWIAGTGDSPSAALLGTVDGYMYAVPICAVFRRNSAPFDRMTNVNGAGLMGSAVSGRPDNLYADQIVVSDVLDLRKGVAWDLTEVLDKTFQRLLDNTLATELEYNQDFGISNVIGGTSFLYKDDITSPPGHIGTSDGVRINFSDRSITESIAVTSGSQTGSTTTVVFHLNALSPVYLAPGTVNLAALAPAGTNISGVGSLRMLVSSTDLDLTDLTNTVFAQSVVLTASTLGGPIDTVTVNLNTAPGSSFTIQAELWIEYLNDNGTKRNMLNSVAFWTPPAASLPVWVDATQLSPTSDGGRFALTNPGSPTDTTNLWWANPGHREVAARLRTTAQGPNMYYADSTGAAIWIPEKLSGTVSINDGINPPYTTTAYVVNANYTQVTLSPAVSANTPVQATFVALRPLPTVGAAPDDSYQIWYNTAAIQSIPVPSGGPITLPLYARAIPKAIHLLTQGSGSPDDSFPYVSPSAQIPIGLLPPSDYPEARLDSPSAISVVGFGINAGYLQLQAMIPYSPDPGQVQLYKLAPDTTIDGDNRNFWPRSDSGSPPIYSPVIWGQSMSLAQQHKVAFPVLMELRADFNGGIGVGSIGRKGTLVMVVFSRWGEFDQNVNIGLQPGLSDSAAAVYRVPGNMLNPRRVAH
jgi:hypothetical protein